MLEPRRVQTSTNQQLDLYSCDLLKKSSLINDNDRLFPACLHCLLENVGGRPHTVYYTGGARRAELTSKVKIKIPAWVHYF